jgi:membrane protein DedA with SNARE-associated domain
MDHEIFQFLSQFAYQPVLVYSLVAAMLLLSSFGLPIPEEVTILSLGFLAYAGAHPDKFPPPAGGESDPLNVHTAAWVCFLAVFLSDVLVFALGRKYGVRFLTLSFFRRWLSESVLLRTKKFADKFGSLCAGVFRFTPALRFPGHFSCGMFGVPPAKFALVDGLAALLSVPTQVYLIYFYGDAIVANIERFKVTILVIGLVVLAGYIIWSRFRTTRQVAEERM